MNETNSKETVNDEKPLTYKGTAYRQSQLPQTPWLISFVAPAEALLQWASIPRRTSDNEIGFQRLEEEKRVNKAKSFFELAANNQSPTALVVGIHPVPEKGKRQVTLTFEDGDESSSTRQCSLAVKLDSKESLDEIVERLKLQISMRLKDEATPSADDEDESEDFPVSETDDNQETAVLDESDGGDGETEGSPTEGDSREIEIGRSVLSRLLEKLENPVWCADNEADLRELGKPATIIDGQHRVIGAAKCERNIPFTVCAIYDCEWAEQVFQFTVVNYTAKGIPDQFITANASMSLTKDELLSLEGRLVQAGVKVVEYELMRVVNFDDKSPFFNLINLTEKKDPTKIGYKTMVRVARRWYDAKNNAVKKLLRNLYPAIRGKGASQRRVERWKDGDWGIFFLTFWKQVHDHYKDKVDYRGKTLWEVGSNLTLSIVLYELQERFLINLNGQADSYFKPTSPATAFPDLLMAVEQRTKEVLSSWPADFFGTEWATKSLNTGAGRDVLIAALRELIDSGGKFGYKRSRLVTGVS